VELHALQKNVDLPWGSKIARFNLFLEDGLIRLGGRLQRADLSEAPRHPLLLDGKQNSVHLLILQTHTPPSHGSSDHSIRTKRGILDIACTSSHKEGATQMSCVQNGKKTRGQHFKTPLPVSRLQPPKPFAITGTDFAGPLYIKVGSYTRQGYIALFTCAITRVVHLELCTDITTEVLAGVSAICGETGTDTPSTRTTHGPFTPPTNTWLYYGPLCPQPKLTNSSLKIKLPGSLSPRGQLVGENIRRG